MPVLNPAFAPVVSFRRYGLDADGNKAQTIVADVPVVVSERTRQAFVPRGVPLLAGDQFEFNGGKYTLAGRARGDMAHPFTGDDLGWMSFDVEFGWTAAAKGVE